ncbi:MAG: protein phosphatase 2C domain-containing protein, partial [Myxococcota bacterium]|nr:protein phosphatase 2C domain-containing protein [Myxococcota bacterium]
PAILLSVSEQGTPKLRMLSDGTETEGSLDVEGFGSVVWLTHVGRIRSRNEDRLLAKSLWGGSHLLLLVADGAGGHEAGDLAAQTAVDTFDECFSGEGPPPEASGPLLWLHDAIMKAHERICALSNSKIRPPASTLVGVLIERESLCCWRFHVGDSRLYVRGVSGMVAQWTRDHNITNGLIDRGLSVEQAHRIADGGRLTQVLGGTSEISPEVHGPLSLVSGQSLLLCSDGVYGHNENPEVLPASMDSGQGDVLGRGTALRDQVLAGEAPDNLTLILLELSTGLEPSLVRETVTNSMPAVSAEEIERRLREREENAAASDVEDAEERATDDKLPVVPTQLRAREAVDQEAAAEEGPAGLSPTAGEGEPQETEETGRRDAAEEFEARLFDESAAAAASASRAAEQAVAGSTEDTRTALLLVFALFVVLVATYSTVVNGLRSEESLPPAVPAVDEEAQEAELPGEPTRGEVEEVELPGEAEPLPSEAESLPGTPEVHELPGGEPVEAAGEGQAGDDSPKEDSGTEPTGDLPPTEMSPPAEPEPEASPRP